MRVRGSRWKTVNLNGSAASAGLHDRAARAVAFVVGSHRSLGRVLGGLEICSRLSLLLRGRLLVSHLARLVRLLLPPLGDLLGAQKSLWIRRHRLAGLARPPPRLAVLVLELL